MKYVILIHSNPQPWAHPTSDFTHQYQSLPPQQRTTLSAHWEQIFNDAHAKGEIISSVALGDPRDAQVWRYQDGPVAAEGPYAVDVPDRPTEHLAGMFVIDVPTAERAAHIAQAFACPGDTIELRPVFNPDATPSP